MNPSKLPRVLATDTDTDSLNLSVSLATLVRLVHSVMLQQLKVQYSHVSKYTYFNVVSEFFWARLPGPHTERGLRQQSSHYNPTLYPSLSWQLHLGKTVLNEIIMTFVIVNSTFIYSNQPRPRLQTELLQNSQVTMSGLNLIAKVGLRW